MIGWGSKYFRGYLLEFEEPGFGGRLGGGEHVPGMFSNDVLPVLEPGDHAKQGKHAQMKECFKWEAARNKPDHAFWSS